MSYCGDKSYKLGKLCLSTDDYYILILNVIFSILIITIYYYRRLSESYSKFSIGIKNNFTLLGEGILNSFYSPLNQSQKNQNTKKKIQTKSGNQVTTLEKSNNELKCNTCGRSVQVSYQYTINKLNSTY
jgi:hypothetical protein